ncbi:serine hydrolase domain-containing protein [Amycolatopsis jejuensis]|uniref:serine hydrolase domain-containing protein n=1 Tax=Amycolatopsis jejuensis TaxID=330084 RepID=UPI00068E98B9|nr:serine hydrolase domain-containing protein [Amycolatopsis jejuensis]
MITHHDLCDLVRTSAEALDIVGAQAAVRQGDQLREAQCGYANLGTRAPVTGHTIFQVGSTTKLFTAALALRLADRNELDIDVPVARYLPAARFAEDSAAQEITPRHLMSMSSGMDNGPYRDTGCGADAIAEYVRILADIPLISPPGKQFGYSNASTIVLGHLLETLTGRSWDDLLRLELLGPLDMRHSCTRPEDQVYFSVAVGHVPRADPPEFRRPWILSRGMGPAGTTLCASASELTRFGQMMLREGKGPGGHQVLSPRAVALMQEPQVAVPAKLFADDWGVGAYHRKWNGTDLYGHSGTNLGGSSTLLWIPEHDVTIATTVNVPQAGYPFAAQILQGVAAHLGMGGPGPATGRQAGEVDPDVYRGIYRSYGQEWEIRERPDGRLLARRHHLTADNFEPGSAGRVIEASLEALGDHRFLPDADELTDDHRWELAFVLGPDGRAEYLLNGAFAARRVAR